MRTKSRYAVRMEIAYKFNLERPYFGATGNYHLKPFNPNLAKLAPYYMKIRSHKQFPVDAQVA